MVVKGEIEKIGWIDENHVPQDWFFNCDNGATAIDMTEDGILYAGYSVDELKEIADHVS